jgi:hypothetical protein
MSLFKNELKEIFCSLGFSKYTDVDILDKFEALFDMLTETLRASYYIKLV